MQLGVIHCKACANRQAHVAFWPIKFHSFFFAFGRTHEIPPREVQCLLCLLVLVWCSLSTSCFKSLIIVSLNSPCNYFESQLVRMIKLLRMLGSRRWKNIFFLSIFGPVSYWNKSSSCDHIYLLWPCTARSLIVFSCSLQKLPYAVGQCMFISICASHLSFHSLTVKLPLTLVLRHLASDSFSIQK